MTPERSAIPQPAPAATRGNESKALLKAEEAQVRARAHAHAERAEEFMDALRHHSLRDLPTLADDFGLTEAEGIDLVDDTSFLSEAEVRRATESRTWPGDEAMRALAADESRINNPVVREAWVSVATDRIVSDLTTRSQERRGVEQGHGIVSRLNALAGKGREDLVLEAALATRASISHSRAHFPEWAQARELDLRHLGPANIAALRPGLEAAIRKDQDGLIRQAAVVTYEQVGNSFVNPERRAAWLALAKEGGKAQSFRATGQPVLAGDPPVYLMAATKAEVHQVLRGPRSPIAEEAMKNASGDLTGMPLHARGASEAVLLNRLKAPILPNERDRIMEGIQEFSTISPVLVNDRATWAVEADVAYRVRMGLAQRQAWDLDPKPELNSLVSVASKDPLPAKDAARMLLRSFSPIDERDPSFLRAQVALADYAGLLGEPLPDPRLNRTELILSPEMARYAAGVHRWDGRFEAVRVLPSEGMAAAKTALQQGIRVEANASTQPSQSAQEVHLLLERLASPAAFRSAAS